VVITAVLLFVLVVAVFAALMRGGSEGGDVSPVESALRAGRRIEAIRLYRKQTGVDSQAAHAAIEEMERAQQSRRR